MVSPTTAPYAMRRRGSLSKARWHHERFSANAIGADAASPLEGSSNNAGSGPSMAEEDEETCEPTEPVVHYLNFYDAQCGLVRRPTTEVISTTTSTTTTTTRWSRRGDGRTVVTITTSPCQSLPLNASSDVNSLHESLVLHRQATHSTASIYESASNRSSSGFSSLTSTPYATPEEHYYEGWPFPTKEEFYQNVSRHQNPVSSVSAATQAVSQSSHLPARSLSVSYSPTPPVSHRRTQSLNHGAFKASAKTCLNNGMRNSVAGNRPFSAGRCEAISQQPSPTSMSLNSSPSSPTTAFDLSRRDSLRRMPASFSPESSPSPRRRRVGSWTRVLKPKTLEAGVPGY